jgi:ABC-2 type transport system permease protein
VQIGAKFTPLWGIANSVAVSAVDVAPTAGRCRTSSSALIFTGLAVLMFRRDTKRV